MNKRYLMGCSLAALLAVSVSASAYGGQKVKVTKVKPTPTKKTDDTDSAEPDKVLYERAVNDVKHSRYTEARLSFQTLINTYPESEYLAKAKLGVADSYYKEGGTSNLTQAVDEYKNFIVFFPFLDEAAYAQMQVGMSHYRMMSKSDRDNSQGESAEDEFQAFLLKYPQSPLVPQAEQDLRNVQEVLADGYYRVARFYYLKRDYRASAARLVDLTQRYPLYSQSDIALAMLADVYMRAKQASKNEDDKNHWADLAARCYSRIVQDYPLSTQAALAKDHLKTLGMPIPAADPNAMERMKKQQMYERHHRESPLKHPMEAIESRPDVSLAARSGEPNLNPPDDLVSATDVLRQGAAGPDFTVTNQIPGAADSSTSGAANDSGGTVVEGPTSESGGGNLPSTGVGAEIIAAPASAADAASSTAVAAPAPEAEPSTPAAAPAADPPAASMLNAVPGTAPAGAVTSDAAPATQTAPEPTGAANATAQTSGQANAQATGGANAPAPAAKVDSKTESTSKKKKGLKKIVPW
jgi:outer membrane protein assembly factor BamD